VKLFPLLGRVKGVTIWALVLQGNLAGVKALIDRGHDVNERNPKDESTPLYCAATAGNFQICKYLLDSGADLNLPGTPEGRTVLHVAIISGEVDIVHLLLQHKDCLPDKADSYSRTAFCYGCALGQLNVVRLLLETQRIDPAVRATVTPEKCTTLCRLMPPIAYACIEGHFTVVHHLIEHGQMKFLDEKVLTVALELGRSHVISFLLLLGLEVKSCRPVLKALRKGRASMAKSVLGHMLSNKSFVDSSDKDFEACIQLSKSRGWDEVTNLLKSIEIS
jgi:ankyrin repeat protein